MKKGKVKMPDTNSTSFNNSYSASYGFGQNVVTHGGAGNGDKKETKVDVSVKDYGEVANRSLAEFANPFFKYLADNENVFNGNVQEEIIKTQTQMFNTGVILNEADEKVNGKAPRLNLVS